MDEKKRVRTLSRRDFGLLSAAALTAPLVLPVLALIRDQGRFNGFDGSRRETVETVSRYRRLFTPG